MHIKDPKHVQKHRIVMISTFVGILIVFGVWAVQIKQMFADQAEQDIAQSLQEGQSAGANYAQQLETLIPGFEIDFEAMMQEEQQAVARSQAQEESQELLTGELLKRFQEKAQEEAQQQEEEGEEIDQGETTP